MDLIVSGVDISHGFFRINRNNATDSSSLFTEGSSTRVRLYSASEAINMTAATFSKQWILNKKHCKLIFYDISSPLTTFSSRFFVHQHPPLWSRCLQRWGWSLRLRWWPSSSWWEWYCLDQHPPQWIPPDDPPDDVLRPGEEVLLQDPPPVGEEVCGWVRQLENGLKASGKKGLECVFSIAGVKRLLPDSLLKGLFFSNQL